MLKTHRMVLITYPTRTPRIDDWQALLESLVVAHELQEVPSLPIPTLVDERTTVTGEADIQAYLKQLEDEVNQWRSPQCGV